MPGRSRSSNGSAEATLERALKFMLRSDFVRKCQSRPHSSPGPRASSHRRPVVKVSLAVKAKVLIGWAPSPPSEGERDGVRGPLSGSWSQCMRTGERGLSMNHVTSGGFWLENHVVFTGQFLEQTLFSLSDFLFIFLESLFHCSAGVLARRPRLRVPATSRRPAVNGGEDAPSTSTRDGCPTLIHTDDMCAQTLSGRCRHRCYSCRKLGYELEKQSCSPSASRKGWTLPSSPPGRGQGWVHSHRTSCCDRHHRDPRRSAFAGSRAILAESPGRRLHQQPASTADRLAPVFRRQQRRHRPNQPGQFLLA